MSTEALKLALEALKESQTDNDTMEFWDRKTKAITAIKQALEAPVQEPVAQYSDIVSDGGLDPRNKFDTAPPAPPECQTEAERTAYSFGWYKALEHMREKNT